MGPGEILENAFSTQIKEYQHHPHDYIRLFGTLSGIMCITLGISMFLFLKVIRAPIEYTALGLLWAFFGALTLWGMLAFRSGKKAASAGILILSGFAGMLLGAGFFLGAGLSVFTGALVARDIYTNRKRRK